LAMTWKYGFKSIKAIKRFTFTDQRPKSFWEDLQASEYGFWANVNPQVPHPRWSQATEEDIVTKERRPTQLLNGYGEYVAHLYKGLENERQWAWCRRDVGWAKSRNGTHPREQPRDAILSSRLSTARAVPHPTKHRKKKCRQRSPS